MMKKTVFTTVALALSIGLQVSADAAPAVWHLPKADLTTLRSPQEVLMPEAVSDDLLLAAAKPARSASAVKKPAGTNAALQQGIRFFNRGYIAKAIPAFEQASRQDPNNANAFLWLARAYQKQGKPTDLEKSRIAYQKVLSINPREREALSNLGEMWSWDPARRDDAISLLRQAYELNPGDASIAKKLTQALFWQGRSDEALQVAAPIANVYRNDRQWMRDYAQILTQTGHADQALQIYGSVLHEDSSRHLPLQVSHARALWKAGRQPEAHALFQEIDQKTFGTATTAQNGEFGKSMASLAFDLGLYNEALKWDQSLPDAIQRQKDVQLRIARTLTRAYRVPEAIEKFQRLYEAGLLTTDEKLEYAEYLRVLHLEADALPAPNLVETLYQEAKQEKPQDAEVALRLARYYRDEGKGFDLTVNAYQEAITMASDEKRSAIRKEFLDHAKSDRSQTAVVEQLFTQMRAESPDDLQLKASYAEFLSWQKERRPEALRLYIELSKADPDNRERWESRLEEVLRWHQPTTDLIPVYQEIVDVYPENKTVWLTVARAYRANKDYYQEASETYSKLVQRHPDDGTIKREWLGHLLANSAKRDENIALLKKMVDENPADPDIRATYGKLLSYDRKYDQAMAAFEEVLKQDATHREALVGKGYVILWSGRKLEGKEYFSNLHKQYPDDVDIAIGLASAEKLIGRYDEALKIMEEIKPLMDRTPESGMSHPDFLPVDNESFDGQRLNRNASYDFSILPYGDSSDAVMPDGAQDSDNASVNEMNVVTSPPTVQTGELNSLQSELNALSDAVNLLKTMQESAKSQLNHLDRNIQTAKDAIPFEMTLQAPEAPNTHIGAAAPGRSVGEGGMTPVYGTYAALDYDTNPLLSGMGRFRNDDISDMEKNLINDLRPMLRAGFLYSRQDGEETTTQLSSWGFPNQLSFSLTPQLRLRGGIRPTKYYIPDGVSPRDTWGVEYGIGVTAKYWDKLTLDGDVALTHFSQSSSENITFQTQAQYDFNDSITAKLGLRRMPQYNSLLSVAGLKPNLGAWRGELVGQARENSIYAELNMHPFSQNVDWNLGYEWAFIDGEHIPRNTKNQAFTSLGYTWHLGANHQVRAGYEFLYFGYDKNATNGFFDVTASGLREPVSSLRPVTLANDGYVFGGYYSPKWFIMNAGRLDFRGSLFNKLLEYKLGGSLGIQSYGLGHGIDDDEDSDTALASSFDANVIVNLTDWLATYGNVDFLDAGGQFNRWRFGGGLIIRPHIQSLSPVLGPRVAQPVAEPNP